MFCSDYDSFFEELEKRHYTPHTAKNADEAKQIALELIGSGNSVGCGGSVTVNGMGLPAALRENGNEVYFHWDVEPAERPSVFPKAAASDWYLCSANAITRKGKIVNIDGNGNRVSGTFFGPKKVILIIGKNKFAEDLDGAMERVKKFACAQNARRFGFKTPCAVAGECTDCYSPQRICKITTIIECLPGMVQEMHLILVDEELGY